MTLLEKLDWLMKKYDLNKSSLARNANIKYTTLDSLYKKGYSNAKLQTLMALARYFNVSLDYLVKDEITNPRYGFDEIYSEKELDILDLYRSADEDRRRATELILGYKRKGTNSTTDLDHIIPVAARPSDAPNAGDSDRPEDDQNKI